MASRELSTLMAPLPSLTLKTNWSIMKRNLNGFSVDAAPESSLMAETWWTAQLLMALCKYSSLLWLSEIPHTKMQQHPSRMKFWRMASSLGSIATELRLDTIRQENLSPCLFHQLQWPSRLLISTSARLHLAWKSSPSQTGQPLPIIARWRIPQLTKISLFLTSTRSKDLKSFRRLPTLETAQSCWPMTLMAIPLGSCLPSLTT